MNRWFIIELFQNSLFSKLSTDVHCIAEGYVACLGESFSCMFSSEVTDNNCLRQKDIQTAKAKAEKPLEWFYLELHQAVLATARETRFCFFLFKCNRALLWCTEHCSSFLWMEPASLFQQHTVETFSIPLWTHLSLVGSRLSPWVFL